MEIWRQGSNRKLGWSNQRTRSAHKVSIEAGGKGAPRVVLTLPRTTDPDRGGQYDYEVRLSIEDIADLLGKLADTGIARIPYEVQTGLSSAVRDLNRLQAFASGIQVGPAVPKLIDD
jgi:hypothetical protein